MAFGPDGALMILRINFFYKIKRWKTMRIIKISHHGYFTSNRRDVAWYRDIVVMSRGITLSSWGLVVSRYCRDVACYHDIVVMSCGIKIWSWYRMVSRYPPDVWYRDIILMYGIATSSWCVLWRYRRDVCFHDIVMISGITIWSWYCVVSRYRALRGPDDV